MNILESMKTAVSSVLSSKLRAFLTMLGIIIGISSVITIVSIGAGMGNQMEEMWANMGLGNLQVSMSNWGDTVTDRDLLTLDDVQMLGNIPNVRTATATLGNWGYQLRLMDPSETNQANLMGVMPGHDRLVNVQMLYGRYINQMDIDGSTPFAVINDTTAERVFGSVHAGIIGQTVELSSWMAAGIQRFTVVGIKVNPNAEFEAMWPDFINEEVTVPITTLQSLTGQRTVDTIHVASEDPNLMTQVAEDINAALDNSRGTMGNYHIFNPMNFLDQANEQLAMVTLVISGIAAISLLVGGIGVMNIMLVTVTERTREIGIRKSIGARRRDILMQFLIEAVILTFIGGTIGIAIGIGGGRLLGPLMDITPVVNMSSVLLAVGVSCATGLIFGVGPANKASKLDPIEALRYE
ncbi:MAG: ABC transporter permease [Defluviitaleaceae bacterium]|nr:ABC transporter permease [Defluviitaleaceae bacterium]